LIFCFPYKDAFNFLLSGGCCNGIERLFGQTYQRFGMFWRPIRYPLLRVPQIACPLPLSASQLPERSQWHKSTAFGIQSWCLPSWRASLCRQLHEWLRRPTLLLGSVLHGGSSSSKIPTIAMSNTRGDHRPVGKGYDCPSSNINECFSYWHTDIAPYLIHASAALCPK
jgi:hypothetical protein